MPGLSRFLFLPTGRKHVCTRVWGVLGTWVHSLTHEGKVCLGVWGWGGSGTSQSARPFSHEPKPWLQARPCLQWLERQGPGTAGGKGALSKREGDGGGSRQQGLGRGSSCHRG